MNKYYHNILYEAILETLWYQGRERDPSALGRQEERRHPVLGEGVKQKK
jgi:hypothetical protein